MNKSFTLFRLSKKTIPSHVVRPTEKAKTIVRKSFIFILMLVTQSYLAAPFAQAQELSPTGKVEKEKFESLLTDTEPVGIDPYIGQGRGVKSVIPSLTDMNLSNTSANITTSARVHKLTKKSYRPNEDIKVVIENGLNKKFKTEFIDAIGNKVAMETSETETGAAKVITVEQPSSFRPGKYTLRITDGRGGVSEQDFSWGVLAINPDKSIYTPKETANLAIGVLDEKGNMVCDAQVELQITDPLGKMISLSTDNKKIIINPECLSHDFTLKPDYETNYEVGLPGVYKMLLKAQTKNGSYSISDSFEVRASVPFDVKRVTATRIYPPNTYPVTMEVTANQDFNGTITETVPASFKIAGPGQQIDDGANFDPSSFGSASNSAGTQAPDNLPKRAAAPSTPDVMTFNTVNNIQESLGGPAVLGASIPGLSMPFSGPFPISQEFGESLVNDIHDHDLYESFGMHGHDGIDFSMSEGTAIQAVDSGKVLVAGDGDYGITVILQHSWGRSYYGHLSGVDVKEGQEVSRDAVIGKSGNTGISTGPHLHFGIKPETNVAENGFYGKVDPAYYLGMKQSAGAVLGISTSLEPEAPVSTDIKVLTWKVNVKKGDKIQIGYSYLAPRISPQFYTLGPATFTDSQGKEVFHEIRKWQIAADALEMKFKKGSFDKVTCTATCAQTVTGIGFKPKAIIFDWTSQTASGSAVDQLTGMGFATANGGVVQERSVSIYSNDGTANTVSGRRRSDTKSIMMLPDTGGSPLAEADFVSMDTDGFTLNWTSNNTAAYIIRYTAVGGADVSNAKAGSFTLSTGAGNVVVTDPAFRPDFVMTLETGSSTAGVDDANNTTTLTGKMGLGFATSSTEEGAISIMTEHNSGTTDTCRQQRTDAIVLLLTEDATGTGTSTCGTQTAMASFTSMDATGFTLTKDDPPTGNTTIFYLALQGGQYDVGALTQPTAVGTQSVTTGFRPSGISFASANAVSGTALAATAALTIGGASLDDATDGTSSNWCNDTTGTGCTASWSARRKITFNNSASTEDLNNFPVLVEVDATRIDYTKTQSDVDDIRFVDPSDPTTVLPSEREGPSTSSGTNYFWVKVPTIPAGSSADYIYMYYGNSTVPIGDDITNVWDSNYRAVYHLDEATTSTTVIDSTSNANNGTKAATGPTSFTSGPIGRALDFDGTDDYIRVPDSNSLDLTTNGTVSVWMNRDGLGLGVEYHSPVSKGDTAPTENHNYAMEIDTGNNMNYMLGNGTPTTGWQSNQPNTNLSSTALDYFSVMTWNGQRLRMFQFGLDDGNVAQTITNVGGVSPSNAGFLHIGEFFSGASPFDGVIDEVRISGTPRSPSWLRAEYLSGTDAMNTYGAEETSAISAPGAKTFSQGSIWSDDRDGEGTENANMATSSLVSILMATSPTGTNGSVTNAEASMLDFSTNGFTLNWTKADTTARQVLYWAAGSVTATQEDYRWYKNTNALTPTTALEDENFSTIIPENNPYVRLRTSISVGGNGMAASSQAFKLQYAAAGSETAVGGTTDWCNDTTGVSCTSDWTMRKKITFNNAQSTTPLTNFPVLVRIDSSRIDYSKTQNSGQDIRFVDAGAPTVVLDHEIESWNESGYSYVWVRVPQVDASATDSIYMYYDNATAADGQAVTGVWDSNYSLVYHMNDGSGAAMNDSTTNAKDGAQGTAGNQPVPRTTGKVNGNFEFDDTASSATADAMPVLSPGVSTGDFTFETWVNLDSTTDEQIFNILDNSTTNAVDWAVEAGTMTLVVNNFGATYTSASTIPVGQWSHLVVTRSGSTITGYINGVADGSTVSFGTALTLGTGCALNIGFDADLNTSNCTANPGNWLDGDMDEARVSAIGRSADYVKADYLSQSDQFNTFGEEQPYTSGGTSTVGWTDVGTPWCNDTTGTLLTCTTSWAYRKTINIDNQASTTSLTNFPILVKIDSTKIDFTKTQDDGDDIRFVDSSDPNTILPHQIEGAWTEAGTNYVWVKVPQLDAGTVDSIDMYYGNASIGDGEDVTNVWTNSYSYVWHLNETPGAMQDSTLSNNDGTTQGNPTTTTAGKMGNAIVLDGTGDYISTTNSIASPGPQNFTVGLWMKANSATGTKILGFENTQTGTGATSSDRAVYMGTDGRIRLHAYDGSNKITASTNTYTDNAWHYFSGTFDDTNNLITLYSNGRSDSSIAAANAENYTGYWRIGSYISGPLTLGSNGYFPGQVDEVRISSVVRTADWIRAEYLTMNDQMNTFGTEQTQSQALWAFKDNSLVTDRTTVNPGVLSTSSSGDQLSYQESNPTILNPTAIAVGEKREFDFSLDGSRASPRRTYYFRIVDAEGTPLTNYSRYPTIMFGVPNEKVMRGGKFFNYKKVQPFTF